MTNSLDVFVNQKSTGSLSLEDYKYIFNYTNEAKDLVSLTMPVRAESWKNLQIIG
jgi:serine/threonine-protein kinase HipA